MHVEFHRIDWPLASVFRIAYAERTQSRTVLVELREGALTGRGEGVGVGYHGETAETLMDQLAAVKDDLCRGLTREQLQTHLPPGGARNAIDCALWDLEAKRAGRRAWDLAGVGADRSIMTGYTLGLDSPDAMAKAARERSKFKRLKVKFNGDGDLDRIMAVRDARPDAELIVDANQSWNAAQLCEYLPRLAELDIRLLEQPLPVGEDEILRDLQSPIPICADESCQTRESLPSLAGKYQFVNIKLDKTGGLTEALLLAREAQAQGFRLMIGCMAGSSLSMAPAFVVAQLCEIVDLDGPLLAAHDTPNAIHYDGGDMSPPEISLWG